MREIARTDAGVIFVYVLCGDIDMKILVGDSLHGMRKEYVERFGENFIEFNHADFKSSGDKRAAEVYKETLEKVLRDGSLIVSVQNDMTF